MADLTKLLEEVKGCLLYTSAVKEMVDAEYAAGRNTIMGDDELDSMVRIFDKDLHKLFNDRINKKKLNA